jgi:hypothetical protein
VLADGCKLDLDLDSSLDGEDADDTERDIATGGAEEGAAAPALVLVVGCNGEMCGETCGETCDDAVVDSVGLFKMFLFGSVLALVVGCSGDKGDGTEVEEVLFLLLLLFCSGSSSCWKKLYGSTSIRGAVYSTIGDVGDVGGSIFVADEWQKLLLVHTNRMVV